MTKGLLMRGFGFVAVALLAHGADPLRAAPADLPPQAGEAAGALIRGDLSQAVTGYSEALKNTALSNDRRAALLNDRGVAYIKLGDARQAIQDFNTAVQLFPEFPAVYNNRGNLLLSLGLLKEAVKDFDRSIVLAPGYAAAYNNRAGALMQLGRTEDAIRDYSKAVQLLPSNPAPLSGRGRAHLLMSRPHSAIRDFTRAVTQDARFATGYRNRAEAKLAVEHYDEAIEDLSRAIAFDVTHADSYVLRGQAYLTTRNTAAAIKDFSQAIELDPKNATAFASRGFAHGLAEAYDEAYGDLNKAIEIEPRNGLAFAYRAVVYKENGQVDIALRDIEVAAKLDPERAEVYWARAEVKEAQREINAAIADLNQALSLRPGYRDALDALQRLGSAPVVAEEQEVAGAGIEEWRVVKRGENYFAVNARFQRLSVPLEMLGRGAPRLLEWQIKEPPYDGFGLLRFYGGAVKGTAADEDLELVAVIDLAASDVLGIEPHRLGERTANWTWSEGKVVVATVDGATDEIALSSARQAVAAPYRPYSQSGTARDKPWAPWDDGFGAAPASGPPVESRRAAVKRKPKTLFDLLFN